MFTRYFITILLAFLLSACGQGGAHTEKTETSAAPAKDTCESPDMDVHCCFRDVPEDLSSQMVIANGDEPGERIILRGHISRLHGEPLPSVILYAYHTDNKGIYSKKGNEHGAQLYHGHLHSWCKTDANGYYEIQTIRPAPYPGGKAPAHIHAAVQEPGGSTHWIEDFVFDDDPLLPANYGYGVVHLEKKNGVWEGSREIELGED